MDKIIKIHPDDTVAVALQAIPAGTPLALGSIEIVTTQDIPQGHKIALAPMAKGDKIIKYGSPIGLAKANISPGEWVHLHNTATALAEKAEYAYHPVADPLVPMEGGSFQGYLRQDGRAGIRNEIWVVPLVGCVNDVCTTLAKDYDAKAKQAGLGGVYAFPHPYGCSQMGDDHLATRRLLAALVKHPNAGGVLVVGLGCENNTMEAFKQELGQWDASRVRFMVCQQEEDELATGGQLLEACIETAAKDRRQAVSVSHLVLGMKCGGSDGFSGITANPLVGRLSDLLVAEGGSVILTEVPEMFGAEGLLMNRAKSPEVYEKIVGMIEGFKEYFTRHNQTVYENPSPGNKDGGITTLEDKSLGCVQKGGSALVSDVIGYAQPVTLPGLTLMNGPGNDLVSATALAAAGAQMVLFTTGRGTPFGAPVPTLKIATNSQLYHQKPHWIDFNAGSLLEGKTMAAVTAELYQMVLAVASGQTLTRSEENGYRGIAIFKQGVTL